MTDMKRRLIIRNVLLVSLVSAMVLFAGVGKAWAYFTTYARAEGGSVIRLDYDTEIEEEFSDWTKKITISNKSGSLPVYIRVKAFCGGEYRLAYSDQSGRWGQGTDGYWYYNNIVYGGEKTEPLSVRIENIPEDAEISAEFNVAVIYESTLVRYDKNGNPYADWSAKQDTGRTEGGR